MSRDFDKTFRRFMRVWHTVCYTCRKSIRHNHLRQIRRPAFALNPYGVRLYVNFCERPYIAGRIPRTKD